VSRIPCPWPVMCRCDHVMCEAGWLDEPGPAKSCPNCRPELARAVQRNPRREDETPEEMLARNERVRNWPRSSRSPGV
jgi:hypothetical protein